MQQFKARPFFPAMLTLSVFFCSLNTRGQAGSFDLSFGQNGRTYTNILNVNGSESKGEAICLQPDGKILVGVSTISPTAVYRFNADGTPDLTFDQDGKALCFGIRVTSIALQADGKIVIGGSFRGSVSDVNDHFTLARLNSNGGIDETFGTNGRVTTDVLGSYSYITSVLVQPDNRIIAGGYASVGSQVQFAVARYNSNGSLDNSFDGDGITTTAIGSSSNQLNSVRILPDGKLVAGGWSISGSNIDFAVVRYNADGSLDNSFNGTGKVTTHMGTNEDKIAGVVVQPDGKIVAVGNIYSGAYSVALARYNTDGSLDNSFDTDGKVTTTVMTSTFCRTVVLQPDERILLGGTCSPGGNLDYMFIGYNPDGSLDNSFDGDGKLAIPIGIGNLNDQINSLALQPDGKVVAAGYTTNGPTFDCSLARINSNGTLDPTFDSDGKIIISGATSVDMATAMVIQADGKIILGGSSHNGSNTDFALVRYNIDGSLDNSFDADGIVTTVIGTSDDKINALALQNDGKIVAVGESFGSGKYEFSVARYNTDGSLDNTFDSDGKIIVTFGGADDRAFAVVVQPDGKIVVGGQTFNSGFSFALLRFNDDGSLDYSLDADGKLTGTVPAAISAMCIQNDGKLLLAGGAYAGSFQLSRLNINGTYDNSFDSDGMVITQVMPFGDELYALALQADGKIIASGTCFDQSFNRVFVTVRYNGDGSVDNNFDGDGIVTTSIPGLWLSLCSVAEQTDGKIILAGSVDGTLLSPGSGNIALVRYNANGSPDVTFDGDGKKVIDVFGQSGEIATAMKLSSDRIYIGGLQVTEGGKDFMLLALLNDMTPVPLTLLTFSAVRSGNNTFLEWKTNDEMNTDHFEIQGSEDGILFSRLGTLPAANSPGAHEYHFVDFMARKGIYYYRLKMIDIDGQFEYSRTVRIFGGTGNASFVVSPNPASSFITIRGGPLRQIILFGQDGKMVRSFPCNGTSDNSMLLNGISPGFYFTQLIDEKGKIEIRKLIIR